MWALEGADWRTWTAADRAAVIFLLLKRVTKDPQEMRDLFELVEDYDAVAAVDREKMGQTSQIEVPDVAVRR